MLSPLVRRLPGAAGRGAWLAALTWRAEVTARIERSYDVNEGGEAGHAR